MIARKAASLSPSRKVCFNPDGLLGAEIEFEASVLRNDQLLFNESQSRIVLSVTKENQPAVEQKLKAAGVPFQVLGSVGGSNLAIQSGDMKHCWPIAELHDLWFHAIARGVEGDSSPDPIPSL